MWLCLLFAVAAAQSPTSSPTAAPTTAFPTAFPTSSPTSVPTSPAPTTLSPTCAYPITTQLNLINSLSDSDFVNAPPNIAPRQSTGSPTPYDVVLPNTVYKLDTRCATGPSAAYLVRSDCGVGEFLVLTDYNLTGWVTGQKNDAFRSTFVFNHPTPEPNNYYPTGVINPRLYVSTDRALLHFTTVNSVSGPVDSGPCGSGNGHAKLENIPIGLVVYFMFTNYGATFTTFYQRLQRNSDTQGLGVYWGLITLSPTKFPTLLPTGSPTTTPTSSPTAAPTTAFPTAFPTSSPTAAPTTAFPTSSPTPIPTAAPSQPPSCAWAPGHLPNVVNAINDVSFKHPVETLNYRNPTTIALNYTVMPWNTVFRLDTRCAAGPSAVYVASPNGKNGELLILTDYNLTGWNSTENTAFKKAFVFNHETPEPRAYYTTGENNRLYFATNLGLLQYTLVSAVANPQDLYSGGAGGHAKIEQIPQGLVAYFMLSGYGSFQQSASAFYSQLVPSNDTQTLAVYWNLAGATVNAGAVCAVSLMSLLCSFVLTVY